MLRENFIFTACLISFSSIISLKWNKLNRSLALSSLVCEMAIFNHFYFLSCSTTSVAHGPRLYRLKIAPNTGSCLALSMYFPSTGSIIMYGALLLFESEFVHIVAISFTSLILTELLMVALTIQTWHWLMIVGELLSLACYVASLVFLHEFIGERTQTRALPRPFPSHTRWLVSFRKHKFSAATLMLLGLCWPWDITSVFRREGNLLSHIKPLVYNKPCCSGY